MSAPFREETWLLFDHEEDEEASHAADVVKIPLGFRVDWWNEAVGRVIERRFDTLDEAHAWLERAGYRDFTA